MLHKSELATIGEGGDLRNGTVFMYRVFGVPGEDVYLWNRSIRVEAPSWGIRRYRGKEAREWYGDFKTADEALAALEQEIKAAK